MPPPGGTRFVQELLTQQGQRRAAHRARADASACQAGRVCRLTMVLAPQLLADRSGRPGRQQDHVRPGGWRDGGRARRVPRGAMAGPVVSRPAALRHITRGRRIMSASTPLSCATGHGSAWSLRGLGGLVRTRFRESTPLRGHLLLCAFAKVRAGPAHQTLVCIPFVHCIPGHTIRSPGAT